MNIDPVVAILAPKPAPLMPKKQPKAFPIYYWLAHPATIFLFISAGMLMYFSKLSFVKKHISYSVAFFFNEA